MKRSIKIRKAMLLMACMCLIGLTACGERTDDDFDGAAMTTISVKKDGSISSKIVEDFGASYYDAEALKSMIETEIADYKAADGTAQITLRSCEVEAGKTNVLMEFNDHDTYAGYNDERFFAGTVQGADQAGFDLNVTLNSVSGGAGITKADLLGMGDSHIVILEVVRPDEVTRSEEIQEAQTIRVNCYDEILYVGEGVTPVGKKSADVTLPEGFGIIVFK